MLIQTYKDFRDQALLGSDYSNQDCLDAINAIEPTDEFWCEKVTRQLVLLGLRKPIVVRQVKLLDTAWSQYMKKNLQLDKSNTMSNTVRLIDKSPINRWVISLYEQNWGQTRPLVQWLTDQTGDNKCPYIHTLLRTVYKAENNNNDLTSIDDLKTMMANPDIITTVASYGMSLGGLKRIAGETTTSLSGGTVTMNGLSTRWQKISGTVCQPDSSHPDLWVQSLYRSDDIFRHPPFVSERLCLTDSFRVCSPDLL